jgi:hypothetical protein
VIYNGVTIETSNLGRIRKQQGGIIGFDTSDGYIGVTLNKGTVYAHRLICMAWKPIDNPEMYVVNHIDNNGKNNCIENLEWVTQADNLRHYVANHLVRGSSNQGRPIRQLNKDGSVVAIFGSAKEAFDKTGITASSITEVCRNKRKSAGGFIWDYHTNI